MTRASFVGALLATSALTRAQWAAATAADIAGIRVPDSTIAREATETARSSEPQEIFNHSLRSFLFASLIARAKGMRYDEELVYVSAILHDTGLVKTYMSDAEPFEVDGANVAADLLRKHGVAEARRQLAWDAIALHDNGGIARNKQAEVRLVNAGVFADFGAYLDLLRRADVQHVLQAAPRTGFMDVFVAAAAEVAKRKPLACAHSFVADIGYCKVPGFKLPSFCDGIKDDPFAGYEAT